MPAGQRGPLSTRGTVADGGGVLLWNLLLNVKDLRDNLSVKSAACQLSTRHALRVPFQGSFPRSIIHSQIFASRNPAEGNGQLLPPFPLGDGLTAARS